MRDVGDEVPVLPCSSFAAPLQTGAGIDLQSLQSNEALYPIWQGVDSPTRHDLHCVEAVELELTQAFGQFTKRITPSYVEFLEGHEATQGLRKGSQAWQAPNVKSA
jgi:hypothetical protein